VSREEAFEAAAVCYRRAGHDLDAARCYREAGAYRRAAEIYEALGRHREAAESYADAGLPEIGAWLLVHRGGQPGQARALLAQPKRGGRPPAAAGGRETTGLVGPWPTLLVLAGTPLSPVAVLRRWSEYTIGRDPAAGITLDDPQVSWRHAVVGTDGDQWVFEDSGSSGGSWLGRQRITRVTVPLDVAGRDDGIRLGSPRDGCPLEFANGSVSESDWQAEPDPPALRRRLVLARCDIAEGEPPEVIRPVIADACAALAGWRLRSDQVTEEWAVALSEAAARYDQAALVFAAAVRGGRYGAEQRWKAWSARVLDAEIIVPPAPPAAAAPSTA
jgi:FHA domain